jgi:putative lipoic acid-binding regulatory protein
VATLVDEEKVGEQKVDDDEARARALALLEATHQFPCDYAFTVIAFSHDAVTESVRRAARGDAEARDELPGYEVRPSREGKYLSHRFTVRVTTGHEVLQVYARLRTLEGVVTIL